MGKLTITLKDDEKLDELLTLVTALHYVEDARFEVVYEEKKDLHSQAMAIANDDDQRQSPFYRDPQTQVMDREIAAFEAMKATLLANHLGEYVAIFQGAVVDHDADKALLLSRLGQTHPDAVVLVRQVRREPRPPFRLRSPRLHKN